jgi:hypothetical protein
MSGWRSGAGRRGTLLDDAIEDPGAVVGSTPARRTQTVWFLPIAGIAIALAIGAVWYQASLRPAHRALPPPIHAAVLIVPIGAVPDDVLAGVPEAYRDEYGLSLTIADPVVLGPSFGDAAIGGPPVGAEPIASALVARFPTASLVVGVTADRIATFGDRADGDMAQRTSDRAVVISTAPLVSMKTISRSTLFRKLLTRELGFLAWRLPPTDDPYDLLYRTVLNEIDVERVSDHL